jgi:hypothetical protein
MSQSGDHNAGNAGDSTPGSSPANAATGVSTVPRYTTSDVVPAQQGSSELSASTPRLRRARKELKASQKEARIQERIDAAVARALDSRKRPAPQLLSAALKPDFSKLPLLDLQLPDTVYPWVAGFEDALKKVGTPDEEWRTLFLRAPQSVTATQDALSYFADGLGAEAETYEALRAQVCRHFGMPNAQVALLLQLYKSFPASTTTNEWYLRCKATRVMASLASKAWGTQPLSQADLATTLIEPFPERQRIKLQRRMVDLLASPVKSASLFEELNRHLPELERPTPLVVAAVESRPSYDRSQQGRRSDSIRSRPFSCRNCGNKTCTRRESCPAKEATCRNCDRKGHYAVVCRQGPQRKPDPTSTPAPAATS